MQGHVNKPNGDDVDDGGEGRSRSTTTTASQPKPASGVARARGGGTINTQNRNRGREWCLLLGGGEQDVQHLVTRDDKVMSP